VPETIRADISIIFEIANVNVYCLPSNNAADDLFKNQIRIHSKPSPAGLPF